MFFHLAVRAGVARRAALFQLTVWAGVTHLAEVFHLAVEAGGAHHALVFQLAVGAGVAVRAVPFHLAVRAPSAPRAVNFPLSVRAGAAHRADAFKLAARAWGALHAPVFHLSLRAPLTSRHYSPPRALTSALREPRRAKIRVVALLFSPRSCFCAVLAFPIVPRKSARPPQFCIGPQSAMRGALGVATTDVPARGLHALRPRETVTLPRRAQANRVSCASFPPSRSDRGPLRKSATPPKRPPAETWVDEPDDFASPSFSVWDESWEDDWGTRRDQRGSTSQSPTELDDNGEDTRDRRYDYGDSDFREFNEKASSRASWFAESLPSATGTAVSWLLKAVALVSDATASGLQGIFPRSIPRATLRTISYFLWALLFFGVFQKLLSAFTLVGGLALLAIAVASGEATRGESTSKRDFDTRRTNQPSNGSFGTRKESFDAFNDAIGKKRREQFFSSASKQTQKMREFWTEDLSRDGGGTGDRRGTGDRGYPVDQVSGDGMYGPYNSGFDFEPDDFEADWRDENNESGFSQGFVQNNDWSAAATEAATAAASTAAATMRFAQNFATGNTYDVDGEENKNSKSQKTSVPFDGAAGAADAGFAFDTGEQSGDCIDDSTSRDSIAAEPADAPRSFDDWVGRKSSARKSDDDQPSFPGYASCDRREDRPPFDTRGPFNDLHFDRFDGFKTRDSFDEGFNNDYRSGDAQEGYDRWANASRSALNGAMNFAGDVFGDGDENARGYSRARKENGRGNGQKNRWREFFTGRFYGVYQSDLVPVRFEGDGDDRDDEFGDVAQKTKNEKMEFEVKDGRFVDGAWVVDGSTSDGSDSMDTPKGEATR